MTADKWPLYPVAKSGTTYCTLAEGYKLNGKPEPIADYLAYCAANGTYRADPIAIPDRQTAIRDISAIKSSRRWLDIKWSDAGQGFSYAISEKSIWRKIFVQAESIPAQSNANRAEPKIAR